MRIPQLSEEEKVLYALEMELQADDLTLDKIRSIEDRVFFQITEKTQELCFKIFQKIIDKRFSLLEKKIEKLSQSSSLTARIQKLFLLYFEMSEEEVVAEIAKIRGEIELIYGHPEIQEAVERQLSQLEFMQKFPVVEELSESSIRSNYFSRMMRIGKDIEKSASLTAFQALTPVQQREILSFAKEA